MSRTAQTSLALVLCLLLAPALTSCKRERDVRRQTNEEKKERHREEYPMLYDPDHELEETPETYIVRVTTEHGPCWVQVHRSWAPNAADRFYRLVRSGYFQMMPIYRALPNIFLQWGIPVEPDIGKVWKDLTFEPDKLVKSNLEGYVGFAPDPVVGGLSTQVYINLRDNLSIDEKGYVPFGKVIRGLGRMRRCYSKYGEILQEGNPHGPDMALGWERGMRYFKRNFGNLSVLKSISISNDTLEEIESRRGRKNREGREDDDLEDDLDDTLDDEEENG